MNESDIRKYANLMSELGLTGLEVTENDRVVRLERNPAPQTAAPVQTVQVGDTLCVKAEFSFGITEKAICFQRS